MRINSSTKFYTKTLINIIYSAIITILLELIVFSNIDRILPSKAETWEYLIRVDTVLLLFMILGIVVFSVIFMLLQSKSLKYIDYIYTSVNQISSGDFSLDIEIMGDDEFSSMAESLNNMKKEISKIMEKERESEKNKNELITSVAHDLRTPLTSILGYLELLNSERFFDEETKKNYINIAYKKAKRLQKLTEDLFGFTKLNYGKLAMNTKQFDLVKLLSQIMDEFYPSFEKNKLSFELRTNVQNIMMYGDINLIVRLFDNLINNAIKYGSDGKRIDVKIEADIEKAKVMIINYGKPIPNKELPLLFNKFYRVESSRSENTGGTGLGLAIAKNIVDIHKAEIEVESDIRRTVFTVTFDLNIDFNKENFENV